MECLGTDHLFVMLDCPACQALGVKDRLERARRFLYQRNEHVFIKARQMRKVIADVDNRPEYLEKVNVLKYIVPQDPEESSVAAPEVPRTSTPRKSRSILRPIRALGSSAGSAGCPIRLSPDEDEEDPDYDPLTDVGRGSKSGQSAFILQELAAARRERREIQSLMQSFRGPSSSQPTATVSRPASLQPIARDTSSYVSPLQGRSGSAPPPVQDWSGFHIPRRPQSPDSLLDESFRGSECLSHIDDTPAAPRLLAAGQTFFDWDLAGNKTRTEDLSELDKSRFDGLRKACQNLVDMSQFPQEAPEPLEKPSLVFGAPSEAPQPELTIPLPDEVLRSVAEARQHRTGKLPLLNPVVRKGYRIPKDQWAVLGAVRRPDRIFDTYATVKKNARGVSLLEDQKAAAAASLHQETAQATAHILRPIGIAHQAAAAAARLTEATKAAFGEGAPIPEGHSLTSYTFENLSKISELARYSLTAASDAADCIARLNADALRRLRATWLDASRLPNEIKEAVKGAPIESGSVPQQKGVEFTAPIAGECLTKEHSEMVSRVKAQNLLVKQRDVFKRGTGQKRRGQPGSSQPSWKRGRQDFPSQGGRGQGGRQGQQNRPGRGGQRNQRGGRSDRGGHSSTQPKNNQGKGQPQGQGGKSS